MDERGEMDDKLYEGRSSCAIAESRKAPARALRKTESALSLSLSLNLLPRNSCQTFDVAAGGAAQTGRQGKQIGKARRAGASQPRLVGALRIAEPWYASRTPGSSLPLWPCIATLATPPAIVLGRSLASMLRSLGLL